jgi:large subunit ribosomal protein L20
MNMVKGYHGTRSKLFSTANQQMLHSMEYSFRDRRNRKREFRRLWIARINAGTRANGMSYSMFMNGLNKANIEINRKMLSDLAINDPAAFSKLVEAARQTLVKA